MTLTISYFIRRVLQNLLTPYPFSYIRVSDVGEEVAITYNFFRKTLTIERSTVSKKKHLIYLVKYNVFSSQRVRQGGGGGGVPFTKQT